MNEHAVGGSDTISKTTLPCLQIESFHTIWLSQTRCPPLTRQSHSLRTPSGSLDSNTCQRDGASCVKKWLIIFWDPSTFSNQHAPAKWDRFKTQGSKYQDGQFNFANNSRFVTTLFKPKRHTEKNNCKESLKFGVCDFNCKNTWLEVPDVPIKRSLKNLRHKCGSTNDQSMQVRCAKVTGKFFCSSSSLCSGFTSFTSFTSDFTSSVSTLIDFTKSAWCMNANISTIQLRNIMPCKAEGANFTA